MTPEEGLQKQIEAYRRMTPQERLQISFRLCAEAREAEKKRVQEAHPDWSDGQVKMGVVCHVGRLAGISEDLLPVPDLQANEPIVVFTWSTDLGQ